MHALEMDPIEDIKSVLTRFAKLSYGFPVHVQLSYFNLCIKFYEDFMEKTFSSEKKTQDRAFKIKLQLLPLQMTLLAKANLTHGNYSVIPYTGLVTA